MAGCQISLKKCYEDVWFNVINVTGVQREWVGVEFPEKKRYVTLEWPHSLGEGFSRVQLCPVCCRVHVSPELNLVFSACKQIKLVTQKLPL